MPAEGELLLRHMEVRVNHPHGLAGSRQEVEEKTVYIYMTRQCFGEDRTWTSESGTEGPFPGLPPWLKCADVRVSSCNKDVWVLKSFFCKYTV